MTGDEALAALSEGNCPLGHGRLTDPHPVTGGYCESCAVWWWCDSRQIDITAGSAGFSLATHALRAVYEPQVILARIVSRLHRPAPPPRPAATGDARLRLK